MKHLLKAIITFWAVTLAGMFGGQKQKGVRRFGIAGLAVVMDWKRGWPFLFLIPVLVMGYGENSWLMGYISIEWAVRMAYAFLLSIPFIFFGPKRWGFAFLALLIAFQIEAGSAGYVSWFGDILIEDFIRYGTLGALMAFNMFFSGGTHE